MKKVFSTAVLIGISFLLVTWCLCQAANANPVISVAPMSVNLGNIPVGDPSVSKTVTITNKGTSDLAIDSITITGTNASEFSRINNCTTMPAGVSCTITITFAPVIPFGKKSAVMSIASNDPKKPTVDVKLSGQAPPPKISASPMSVNLGSVPVGSSSSPKIVTVKNTGTSALIIDSITLSGTNASEFSRISDCATVPAKGSCTVSVVFTPTIPFGKKSAVMGINSNDPKKQTVNVKLSGQAPPPKISASPMSVNLGSIPVGSSSLPKIVTVKNTGISDLAVNGITITGANAGEFSQTHDCSVLAKGGACSISVTFNPTTAGKKTALVNIPSNDPKKPNVAVKLSGTGPSVDGGGGHSKATVNGWSTEKAIGIAILSQQLSDFSQGMDILDMEGGVQKVANKPPLNIANMVLTFSKKYLLNLKGMMHTAGSESGKESCYDGGSISYTIKWDGSNEPEDCDDIRNLKLTAKFNSCQVDDILMNGSFYISFTGDACEPSAMTFKFTNFSLNDPYGDLSFNTSQLELALTELVWSYGTIHHMKVICNGDVYASYENYQYAVDYNNFFTIIDTVNDTDLEMMMGGSLTGDCLDGWITIDTIEPILMNMFEDCPKRGTLKVSGNGELTVEFFSDGSLNIADQHYNSCKDLNTACTR